MARIPWSTDSLALLRDGGALQAGQSYNPWEFKMVAMQNAAASSKVPGVLSPEKTVIEKRPDRPVTTPVHAQRMLEKRTGGTVSRATFYRWLASGRIFSVRMGHRIYIPLEELENIIKQCRAGERI